MTCNSNADIVVLKIPFVFRYLVMELLACNVSVSFAVDAVQPAHDVPSLFSAGAGDDDEADSDDDELDEGFGYDF